MGKAKQYSITRLAGVGVSDARQLSQPGVAKVEAFPTQMPAP